MTDSNFDTAVKAEAAKVVRCYQAYTSEQRAGMEASFRLGHRQRKAHGRFYYTHPAIPDRAFDKRFAAARAAVLVVA